jgi:hypothetical protein
MSIVITSQGYIHCRPNRKTNTTALLAAVDDELNWGNTLYDAIHHWLQDAVTPSTCVFLVGPANERQAYKFNFDKWQVSELKEIKTLTELDFAEIVGESSVPPGHPKLPLGI